MSTQEIILGGGILALLIGGIIVPHAVAAQQKADEVGTSVSTYVGNITNAITNN